MPLIVNSSYSYNGFWKNKHFQTLIPYLTRKVQLAYTRERIDTPDNDFLDLDWSTVGSSKICILLHGLEGDSSKSYVKGMAKALNQRGLDAIAMNYRGCSGEPNKLPTAYHSGKTDDIDLVLKHLIEKRKYKEINLIGFSIGGNLALKYLGKKSNSTSPLIKKAAVLCCPIDLKSTSDHFSLPQSKFYLNNFLRSFKAKLKKKAPLYPEKISLKALKKIKTFWDLDNYYTAPFHGFENATDYYEKVSSINFLPGIQVPTLMITAKNDPFLPEINYPIDIAQNHKYLFLEITDQGGHLGYPTPGKDELWTETRIADFMIKKID